MQYRRWRFDSLEPSSGVTPSQSYFCFSRAGHVQENGGLLDFTWISHVFAFDTFGTPAEARQRKRSISATPC